MFVVLLCRGLAWLSCWLESHTPAAHLIISSTHTLLSAGLFRLFGVVHGLSDSSVSCDSGLLCQCVCYLANIQVPASRTSALCLHSTVDPWCYSLQSLALYLSRCQCESPPQHWATCCTTCLSSSLSHFCCLPLLKINSSNHLPVWVSTF